MGDNETTNNHPPNRWRIDSLTPAQRALLEQRLMEKRAEVAHEERIPRLEHRMPVVASPSQVLIWLLSEVLDGGVAYNVPGAFHLQGVLDLDVLARALEALVERHAILRTTYGQRDGELMQSIGRPYRPTVNVVDLRTAPDGRREDEAQRVMRGEARFRFELATGPVFRATVIRMTETEQIFLLTVHHIATDGYSRGQLYRELTALYDAFAAGQSPSLPAPLIEYADYAVWHRRLLESGALDRQLEYWRAKLAGIPSRLDLPTDFAPPRVRRHLGDYRKMFIDLGLRNALYQAARRNNATLFVSLVSLFAALLSRYAGQDDIVIGTPFVGRGRSELDSIVGYFVNPLALRIDLSGDPSFNELIQRVRETTIAAFANADVPYARVVEAINPERDLSQTPVFQAMIVLQNPEWQTNRPKFEPYGIRCSEISPQLGWSKFDLLLGASERTTGLATAWEYSTELFQEATILRLMDRFRLLAEGALADADRPLSGVNILTDRERKQLLVRGNATTIPGAVASIKVLFERQAAALPDAPAVVCGDDRRTYRELNREANRICGVLKTAGVGPGVIVAILIDKSVELIAALLGTMKAGGAYLPLDPRHPVDRLTFMIANANPAVLVTTEALVADLCLDAVPHVVIDSPGALDRQSEGNPSTNAGASDPAYVIYTSGSTGRPKGVTISNGSLAQGYRAWRSYYRLHRLNVHAQLASPSFDVFTEDMLRALLSGAKLVLCPLEVVVDPALLYEVMRREGVDAVEFVPATATSFFEYVDRAGLTVDFLRLVVVGGEAWPVDRYRRVKGLCGSDTRVVNSYGLTETTIDNACFEWTGAGELALGRSAPIGRPLDHTRMYILGDRLDLQPVGIPGQLYLGGDAVAIGYLNQSGLTAERFLPDPFTPVPGARMYRTGDRARWRPDGNVELLSRTDRQLKIRGFRIEPGEIESVIERHPVVSRAAVVAAADQRQDAYLAAYVVPRDHHEPPQAASLRDFVSKRLPGYMVPASWTLIDELPVGSSGKVNYDALAVTPGAYALERANTTDAITATERQLLKIWRDLLEVPDVYVTDNFFALGGHSLLAVRLFTAIERRFGTKLPLALLFESPTITQLGATIDAMCDGRDVNPSLARSLSSGAGGRPFFLIPWLDGELLGYRDLVEALAPTMPIYGLVAPGTDGHTIPLRSIEALATHYIGAMRTIDSSGSYCFGGFCFAGVVAFEMARQLAEQGKEPEMVALIDSYYYGARTPSRLEIERAKWAGFRLARGDERLRLVSARIGRFVRKMCRGINDKGGVFTIAIAQRLGLNQVPGRHWKPTVIASTFANKRYRPVRSRAHIHFFSSGETDPDTVKRAWLPFAVGGLELHRILGTEHTTLLKSAGAPFLAREMAKVFAEYRDPD
jgi:amino acid adenylation domain-containing protein